MLALKPALMRSLKTPSPTVKTTTGCVSGVFFRPQKGARYPNPQTGLWLSTDPAMGEYVPQAPINDDRRKQNGNLPGMGGVFNVVNLHVYHYAGNNPVKYVDPDGEADIDYDNKIITADFTLKDLEDAAGLLDMMGSDFIIIATDEKNRNFSFDYNSALNFIQDIKRIQDKSGVNWDMVKTGVIDILLGGATMLITGAVISGSGGAASPFLGIAFVEGLINLGWGFVELAEGLTGREKLPNSLDLFLIYSTKGRILLSPEMRKR